MRKPFDKIKLSHLQILCNTIADSEVRQLGNIKRKYLESALSFDETLYLLEDLKIVKRRFEELFLIESFLQILSSTEDFKRNFLQILFSAKGDVYRHLKSFLLNFQTGIDNIFFEATDLQKIKFSATRNLLLELDFVMTGVNNRTYIVNPSYKDLFVKIFNRKTLSPKSLQRRQAKNDLLGLAAEEAIINFEFARLTNISLHHNDIVHVSRENVLSGYDIKSFEDHLDGNNNKIERYIEVKAVSSIDFQFYWSRNEMQMAKLLGATYFLYLLPVTSINTFDIEKLLIIRNPINNIYLSENWVKKVEMVSLSKIDSEPEKI